MARDHDCAVAECWEVGDWFVDFQRSLSCQEFERWLDLKAKLEAYTLDPNNADDISWGLEAKGIFTTRSLYRFILNRGGGFLTGLLGTFGNAKRL